MPVTNRGAKLQVDVFWRGAAGPTTFYAALCSTLPTVDTNTLSELTQVSATNGYTNGGMTVSRSSTGFPSVTEDDTANTAYVSLATLTLTASGGSIGPFQYVVITGDGGTVANRETLAWFALPAAVTIPNGATWSGTSGVITGATT